MIDFQRYLSDRGIPLVLNVAPPPGQKVLTVECYCKWYTYQLVSLSPGGCYAVENVAFYEAEPLVDFAVDGSAYCDHVPNPRAMKRLAEKNGWTLDTEAYEMVLGRWIREVLDKEPT